MLTVSINGEPHSIPEELHIRSLLEWLEIPLDRVAVECNRQIVHRNEWARTKVQASDSLEIVQFVGGGKN